MFVGIRVQISLETHPVFKSDGPSLLGKMVRVARVKHVDAALYQRDDLKRVTAALVHARFGRGQVRDCLANERGHQGQVDAGRLGPVKVETVEEKTVNVARSRALGGSDPLLKTVAALDGAKEKDAAHLGLRFLG
jgi:hypothetical protein